MNCEFESDSKQLCSLSLDSRGLEPDEQFSGQDSKMPSKSSEIHSQFGFSSSFASLSSKPNCRDTSTIPCCGVDGTGRSVLKDSLRSVSPASTSQPKYNSSSSVFAGEQAVSTSIADSLSACVLNELTHSTLESLKPLSLKSEIIKPSNHLSSGNIGKPSRNVQIGAISGDTNVDFDKSQSHKLDSSGFMIDTPSNSSNSSKFQSSILTENVAGIDSAFPLSGNRGQLTGDGDNTPFMPNSIEGHCGPLGASSWNSVGANLDDFSTMQAALSANASLNNFICQQASSSSVNGINSQAPNSTIAAAFAAARRAITGGHQNSRPGLSSRSPGWNQPNSGIFESNMALNSIEQSNSGSISSGVIGPSKSNWMTNLTNNGNSYPWNSSALQQQNIPKANYSEVPSAGFSCSSGTGLRYSLSSLNSNSTSGLNSNGFVKNPTSSGLANMYNMFPKRPQHRMMAHWQQQQQHQNSSPNSLVQQTASGSVLNKLSNPVFSCAQMSNSSFVGHDGMQPPGISETSMSMNSKVSHASFTDMGQNSVSISTIPNNMLMGNSLDGMRPNTLNTGNISAEKLSLEQLKFGLDSQVLEVFKNIDTNGSVASSLLDDMSLSNLGQADNYPNQMIAQLSSVPPPSCRPGNNMLSAGIQNAGLSGIGPQYSFLSGMPPREEGFSRKVFVGGLPPDIDEEEITTAFRRFGSLIVDWPHKTESKAYFPPKGYCFLLFQEEQSVQSLISACIVDESKYYWCVSSPTMKDKPVQIRPWNLADSDFVMDGSQPLDPRKTIFVGGVPRPLRAIELALIMDRLYGGVCYAGIDIDPELKYPKGAGRVAFSNQQSYIAAISARFVQLQHNDIDKRVEVKPYVLDNQMCDECQGTRCGGKFAPFFCANVTCLQYYCEQCWVQIHSHHGREYHKPLVKEGAERPRPALYRWS